MRTGTPTLTSRKGVVRSNLCSLVSPKRSAACSKFRSTMLRGLAIAFVSRVLIVLSLAGNIEFFPPQLDFRVRWLRSLAAVMRHSRDWHACRPRNVPQVRATLSGSTQEAAAYAGLTVLFATPDAADRLGIDADEPVRTTAAQPLELRLRFFAGGLLPKPLECHPSPIARRRRYRRAGLKLPAVEDDLPRTPRVNAVCLVFTDRTDTPCFRRDFISQYCHWSSSWMWHSLTRRHPHAKEATGSPMCDTLERLILSVEVYLSQRDADLKVFTAGGQLRCQDWGDLYQWGVTPRRHLSRTETPPRSSTSRVASCGQYRVSPLLGSGSH